MKQPLVYTIVLTWNSKEFIEKCINSVLASTYPTEILIIDNNSTDGTEEYIRKKFNSVKFIQNNKNLGYAGGNNVGIREALKMKADFIFILNPDATIAQNCISELVNTMLLDTEIGMASPKIYYQSNPKKIWFAGGIIDWKKGLTPHIGYNEVDRGQYNSNSYMDRVCGCAVMIRTESLNKIGLLDENYFLYFEETDLSVRFTNNRYKLLYVSEAECWHKTSSSTGGHFSPLYQYYMTRNNLYFMSKYGGKYSYIFLLHFLNRNVKNIFQIIIVKKNKSLPVIISLLKGVMDYYLHNFGKQR
ncbi:glycosyltransferase family 2 protein [Candidatus Microgenomates bacterium]|nr:MAG: glycosyltransferase family 2 protein [Candidatus Microgenomates bacterium]